MKCPKCNHDNNEKKYFCEKCGERIVGEKSELIKVLKKDKAENDSARTSQAENKNKQQTKQQGPKHSKINSSANTILEQNNAQDSGFVSKAWSDIKNSTSWVKKLVIAGLCNIIPIMNFAVSGHAMNWGLDAAQGKNLQLEHGVFEGNRLKIGFFEWLVWIVYGIVFGCASLVLNSILGWIILLGSLLGIALLVAYLFFNSFTALAAMQIAFDERLASSFEIKKIWQLWKKKVGQIFSCYIFPALICKAIAIIASVLLLIIFTAGQIPQILAIATNAGAILQSPAAFIQIIQLISALSLSIFLAWAVFGFMGGIEKMIRYRAIGKFIATMNA